MGLRWPVQRRWIVRDAQGKDQILNTKDLSDCKAVCLLGAAGLGKTYELAVLSELERATGKKVVFRSLAHKFHKE
jgi:ABC-type nitrate/sulfonate/bicarbonate transport system ATPase subunit